MKYGALIKFIFFVLLVATTNAQIISHEGFESASYPPSGWSVYVTIPGGNIWVRQTSPTTNPATTAHGGTAVSRFRSRNASSGSRQYLVSRKVDLTNRGNNPAYLEFWMYRDSLLIGNADSLTVWVSEADTLNANSVRLGAIARNRRIALPDTQAVNAWYKYSYTIPDTFTGTNTRYIFQGTSRTVTINQGANIYIDDVRFDEYPPLCSDTPKIGIIVNNNPVICDNLGNATLSLSDPIDGIAGITYNWEQSFSDAGPWVAVGVNSSTLQYPGLNKTTYFRCTATCSFSNLSYTTAVDSVIVLSRKSPVLMTSPSTAAFCAGSPGVQLTVSGALNYIWTPGSGLDNNMKDTVMATPLTSTQYIVTGIDSFGCKDTALVTVIVNPLPATNITAAPNDSICMGSRVFLSALPAGGGGNRYEWSNGVTTRVDTIVLTQDSTFSVNVTSGVGCVKGDTITLISLPVPKAAFGQMNTVNTFLFSDSSLYATSWLWNFGDGKESTERNPVHTFDTAGIYTVTLIITGEYCGNDTISKLVMSGPICTGNPDIGEITKPSSVVCENSDVVIGLSKPIIGLSGLTYNWEMSDSSSGPWTSTGINSIQLDLTKLSKNTYVRCSASCSFSNLKYTTSIDSILILQSPDITLTPPNGSVCQGATSQLIIASGAANYSWHPTTGLNSTTGDSVIANPNVTTVYTVVGAGQNGCIDSVKINVVVNPLPATNITAAPNDTICKGGLVILSALQQGGQGNAYLWSNNIKSRRDTLMVHSDTTLSVLVTTSAGCMKSDTITITSLVAKFDCSGDKSTFTFLDKSMHGTTWHWNFGDGKTSTEQDPIHFYESTGNFKVTLVVSNAICRDTVSKEISISILNAIDIDQNSEFAYSPNPVQDELLIRTISKPIQNIRIMNRLGQKMYFSWTQDSRDLVTIPTASFVPGIYVTELEIDGKTYVFKFIKA